MLPCPVLPISILGGSSLRLLRQVDDGDSTFWCSLVPVPVPIPRRWLTAAASRRLLAACLDAGIRRREEKGGQLASHQVASQHELVTIGASAVACRACSCAHRPSASSRVGEIRYCDLGWDGAGKGGVC